MSNTDQKDNNFREPEVKKIIKNEGKQLEEISTIELFQKNKGYAAGR